MPDPAWRCGWVDSGEGWGEKGRRCDDAAACRFLELFSCRPLCAFEATCTAPGPYSCDSLASESKIFKKVFSFLISNILIFSLSFLKTNVLVDCFSLFFLFVFSFLLVLFFYSVFFELSYSKKCVFSFSLFYLLSTTMTRQCTLYILTQRLSIPSPDHVWSLFSLIH